MPKGSLGGAFCIERHVELRSHAPIEIFYCPSHPFLDVQSVVVTRSGRLLHQCRSRSPAKGRD